ncbi:NADH-quinone oxidoreductase subunit C [Streptomyces parvulus]|uniref:NADH-quinone oxidoreductase subunit C n=1 Tax=Streptomyces parvulus TaxID=146923 RepID=UPI0036AFDCC9
MTRVGWLPAGTEELFGPDATAEESYDVLTVDVPPASWIPALETARDRLGCTYFDWLSAVDEPGTGFRVAAHVVALGPVRRLLLRTTVPHESPVLPTAVAVYAGAAWHERETHEMFGVAFEDHPALDHLLLPEGFEGHPLRKDFVLAARVAKAWPGAKEPGESDHGGPRRRQMLPPGVPDPNEWGPQKGQLPPAPARGAARAAGERPARAAGDRPARRTRTSAEGSTGRRATEGSPSQPPAADAAAGPDRAADSGVTPPAEGPSPAPRRARRSRSASQGSVSQSPAEGGGTSPAEQPSPAPRRARSASQGSASQRGDSAAEWPESAGPSSGGTPAPAPRSPDAPWHHDRPAFDAPSGRRTEDDAPKEPRAPGEQPEPATPARRGEPAEPTESAVSAEAAETAEPRETPEPADAAEPAEPTEPPADAEPTEPAEPPADAEPTEPPADAEPVDPDATQEPDRKDQDPTPPEAPTPAPHDPPNSSNPPNSPGGPQ